MVYSAGMGVACEGGDSSAKADQRATVRGQNAWLVPAARLDVVTSPLASSLQPHLVKDTAQKLLRRWVMVAQVGAMLVPPVLRLLPAAQECTVCWATCPAGGPAHL